MNIEPAEILNLTSRNAKSMFRVTYAGGGMGYYTPADIRKIDATPGLWDDMLEFRILRNYHFMLTTPEDKIRLAIDVYAASVEEAVERVRAMDEAHSIDSSSALINARLALDADYVDAGDIDVIDDIEIPTKGARFKNVYECPGDCTGRTQHAPYAWDDLWDSMCNDKCPLCNAEIEPSDSTVIDRSHALLRKATQDLYDELRKPGLVEIVELLRSNHRLNHGDNDDTYAAAILIDLLRRINENLPAPKEANSSQESSAAPF